MFVNIGVFEDDDELVLLLDGTGNLVKEGEADDVFELLKVKVEHDELVVVLDDDVVPVDVLELVVVLLGKEDDVIV